MRSFTLLPTQVNWNDWKGPPKDYILYPTNCIVILCQLIALDEMFGPLRFGRHMQATATWFCRDCWSKHNWNIIFPWNIRHKFMIIVIQNSDTKFRWIDKPMQGWELCFSSKHNWKSKSEFKIIFEWK